MPYMKTIYTALFVILLMSCSSSSEQTTYTTVSASSDTVFSTVPIDSFNQPTPALQAEPTENDCVFDTSIFKFTTEALLNYDAELLYQWDATEKQAIVPFKNGDTLILSIGGCDHFSYWAEYKTKAIFFNNEKYVMDKSLWIAKNFFSNGFDSGFVKFINTNHYTLERTDANLKVYSIQTDSTVTEMEVYDAISVEKRGDRITLSINGYVN